ncbi:SACOL1771 family peroxiredoxin [Halobacillus litoralis]|nr:SACOL1771 family peroxiredoxin [Halobacillus litoralis]
MVVTFCRMTQQEAEEIAAWHYPPPYDFYDMTADEEDYEAFIDPHRRSAHTYSAYKAGMLIGFFTIHPTSEETVDVGLGLRPDLTGQGRGASFVAAGLDFAERRCGARVFTLSVAAFNERAVEVYRRAGFKETHRFDQKTNGGTYPFIAMKKDEGGCSAVALHHFHLKADWPGGRNEVGRIESDKLKTEISIPKEMDGPDVGTNPDEMLLGAAATCYIITLAAMIERADLPLQEMDMTSEGQVDVTDGVFTYKKIIHRPRVVLKQEAGETDLKKLHRLVEKAEKTCMISRAIEGNVALELVADVTVAS